MGRHPTGLLVIIFYKTFTATVLTITAIAILLSLKNFPEMQSWAEDLVLAGRQGIIKWIVEHVVQLSPKTFVFGAVAMLFYAALSGLEAIGLWYEKAWGRWLILISIGISIPVEIYELSKGFSWMKLVVFLLNIGIFAYVLLKFPKHHGAGKPKAKS
jgi:uncharacterized membrane protein (DUF2068 family)